MPREPQAGFPFEGRTLHEMRREYSPAAAEVKLAILEALPAVLPHSLDGLVRLHADLLFLRAFPDNARVHALAREQLSRIERNVRRFPARLRQRLTDSGMAGSVSRYAFQLAIAEWLAESYPDEVDIDWASIADFTRLDALLQLLTIRAEDDLIDSDDRSARQWLELVRGRHRTSPNVTLLACLLRELRGSVPDATTRAALYASANLPLIWRLGSSRGSVTRNELPDVAPVFRRGTRAAPRQPVRHVATPLHTIALLPAARAADVIHLARTALSARAREVHAVVYGNPEEVWWCDLGEGVCLAVIGVLPAKRMSLEANYAWFMIANGVPIGYGGVSPLFHQANTGINIFDPFRQSEAPFLWAQCLRAFHKLFGVTRFLVNADQFGEGNPEAIRSGAFWFYHKLGFRPADPAVRKLAAVEMDRLKRRRGYRSPPATLRQLATGDVYLTLRGFPRDAFFDEALLVECSSAVTRLLAEERTDSRSTALDIVVRRVREALGISAMQSWPAGEQESFVRLATVVALIPDIAQWSARDRGSLVDVMRAKGRPQEREYARLAREHPRFRPELTAILCRSPGAR